MSKCVLVLGVLVLGASFARGQTTDDYYSVQNGYWDQASTWTSPVSPAFGYPRTGDVVRSNAASGPIHFYRLKATVP